MKLHRQFGHTTAEKLKKLVRDANIRDTSLEQKIDKVTADCSICKRYKKPQPKPVVSVPMGSKFNEVLAMDLKIWGKKYFLVLVDLYTRYCSAVVIKDKNADTIIQGIFRSWIVLFGAPGKILSDNGCEFNNSEMRLLGEAFNVKILTTAAESPWSNGVCERLNAVLSGMVRKILADCPDCGVDVALSWAVAARNALSNFSGFSPNQLVFGQNPGIPGAFYDGLPGLERETTPPGIVRNNLNALHAARRAFTQAESSERLKRALCHNVRESDPGDMHYGDEVFYKRLDSPEWRGPGTIIGKDGKQFLVKHGGMCVRVHTCRITRAPISADAGVIENVTPTLNERNSEGLDDSDSDTEDDTGENEDNSNAHDDPVVTDQRMGDQTVRVKVGQRIKGIDQSSGEWISGKIVSRAGKATGKFKNRYNIKKDSDGNVGWVDLDRDFSSWETVDDDIEMLVFFNTDEVMQAKKKEIDNWMRNEVYEEADDVGQQAMSVRWVVTEKVKEGKSIVKARLVARGFEEDTMELQKNSPTCSREAVRLAISFASANGWVCNTMDIRAAYLQGYKIERELYLRPPP